MFHCCLRSCTSQHKQKLFVLWNRLQQISFINPPCDAHNKLFSLQHFVVVFFKEYMNEYWAYTAGSRNNILWHKQLLLNGLDNRIWARGKQIAFYTKYIVIYPSAHMPSNKNSEVMLWFDMHPAVIKLVLLCK